MRAQHDPSQPGAPTLDPWTAWAAPVLFTLPPEEQARALAVGGSSLVAILACLFVGLLSLSEGGGDLVLVVIGAGAWFTSVLMLLVRTGRVRLASTAFLVGTTGAFLAALTVTGGLASPLVSWIPVYPLLFLAVAGQGAALAALGLAGLAVLGWSMWPPEQVVVATPLHLGGYALTAALVIQLALAGREHALASLRGQREAEARARADAEAAVRARTALVATVSHELRTPVAGILGLMELVQDADLDFAQIRAVRAVQDTGQALLSVVEDLLDVARLEHGEIVLVDRVYAPTRLCDQVVALLEPSASARGLVVRCEVDAELPKALRGDAARLRQVLVNLVANAVKFTDRGEVCLRATADGDTLIVQVRDTGCGIPQDRLPQVMQPFVQADAARDREHGAGLGLAIVDLLARRMGGTVQIASVVGDGTVVTLRLPLRPAYPDALQHEAEVDAGSMRPLRVLLVDDNPVNRQVLRAKLVTLGHAVRSAEDGRQALNLLAEELPDVLLLDVHMPGMAGTEVAQRVRAEAAWRDLPILGLTSDALPRTRAACLEAGYSDLVVTPVSLPELREGLERVTARAAGAGAATRSLGA